MTDHKTGKLQDKYGKAYPRKQEDEPLRWNILRQR